MMPMRSSGSSRNAVKIAFSRRLAARSMALAFGRSRVTSRIAPSRVVRTPSCVDWRTDMSRLLRGRLPAQCMQSAVGQANQRVDCDGAEARWPNDDGVDVDLDESIYVGFCVTRAGEHGLDERGNVTGRFAAETCQQLRNFEAVEGRLDRRCCERGKQRGAVP